MSIHWWIGKQNMVYPYNGVLLSHKKEWNTDPCYDIDKPWKHYAKWNKLDIKGHMLWFHLYEMFRRGKFIKTENRLSVAAGWGRGKWEMTTFIYLFIYFLFLAVLGLRFCARAFYSCGKRGPLFIVVRGPLTIAASPIVEHRLQTRRLSNCGSRA